MLAIGLGVNALADHSHETQWGGPGTGPGQFTAPLGIASNGEGLVYVADASADRVQVFTADGAHITAFGAPGAGPGELSGAGHVAVDEPTGSVYVADTANARVQRFTQRGVPVAVLGMRGLGDGQFQSPSGVAVDSLGNVFVADSQTNRVQRFTADGAFDVAWSTTAPNELGSAQDVAVDVFGDVYVVDSARNRVEKFTRDGARIDGWGGAGSRAGQFDRPSGVATDGEGNVYVADTGNDRIQMFTFEGAHLESIGRTGSGAGELLEPVDVASDRTGAVYVADRGNARVQKFAAQTPPLPPPVLGETANVAPASGAVFVRPPRAARFTPLTRGRQIPIGSLVQATNGAVRLTTASNARGGQQTARFHAGLFRVVQRRSRLPVTEVQLRGGRFDRCPSGDRRPARAATIARAAATKRSRRAVRRLWSDGKGRFRSRGRRGAAGARGTSWLTEDRCDGTLIRVRTGTVEVRDFARRRTVIVTAGRSYLIARP